jgi:hypothetical protein
VAGMGGGEYLPTEADKNRFYIAARENTVLVLEGNGKVENVKKDGLKLTCQVTTLEDNTLYEFPYIYYPGYEIRMDGIIIENYETKNGFLGFKLEEKTEAIIEVKYAGTKLMKFSYILSLIGIVGFIVNMIKDEKIEKSERKEEKCQNQ